MMSIHHAQSCWVVPKNVVEAPMSTSRLGNYWLLSLLCDSFVTNQCKQQLRGCLATQKSQIKHLLSVMASSWDVTTMWQLLSLPWSSIAAMQTCSSSSSPWNNQPPLPPSGESKQATTSKKASELKCEWSADKEEHLILFLLSKIASICDGGNFRQVTWNAAVVELAKVSTKGPNKTLKVCSSKYSWVCLFICSSFETTEHWLASSTIQAN